MLKAERYCPLFFILIAAFIFSSCENDDDAVRKVYQRDVGVEEAKKVLINYTIGGKTKAILKSPLMLRVQDTVPYVEFPKTLHVDFYNESGVMESFLDALYAKYKEHEAVVFIRDSVIVINQLKGDTLYCHELYWDQKRQGREFYTDKPVRIRTRTQVIDGVGMESGQDFRNWKILEPRGSIQVPASRFPG